MVSGDTGLPRVGEWLEGQTMFITGASGYIGKVLVEKLLRTCPKIKKIFILLRAKRGKRAEERLQELFSSSMFDKLKSQHPEVLAKVHGVEGDVAQANLGLSQHDVDLLQAEVSLVFNAAASVRFDDPLREAVFTNTRSARDALSIARGMKNLKCFVHVSTAYTNCHQQRVPESVQPCGMDAEKMILAAETMEEQALSVLEEKMLGSYPNTYIFTKNLAENLAWSAREEIPVVIYRPAVVIAGVCEPEPGWTDNLNSVIAVSGAAGKGVLRLAYGDPDAEVSYISVDVCVNAMIASAWYRDCYMRRWNTPVGTNIVFNATDFSATNREITEFAFSMEYVYPLSDMLWKGYFSYARSDLQFYFLTFLLHVLPGCVLDLVLRIKGDKPRLLRIYRKFYNASLNLRVFMSTTWEFETNNFRQLLHLLCEEDRRLLYMRTLEQLPSRGEYYMRAYRGMRKLFGDPEEVTKDAIKHAYKMYWVDLACRLVMLCLLLWLLPFKTAVSGLLGLFQHTWTRMEGLIS